MKHVEPIRMILAVTTVLFCGLSFLHAQDGQGGKQLLRVVEESLAPSIADSLAQQRADLTAAGWTVEDVTWPARSSKEPLAHIRLAQQVIWPRVLASPGLHVFLVGRLPVP